MDGDTLKLCQANLKSPRPEKFEAVSKKISLLVFKRVATKTVKAGVAQSAFAVNEALADATYTERVLRVTGDVLRVRRSGSGYILSVAGFGQAQEMPLLFGFDMDDRSRLAKLKAGDKVTVEGFCRGRGKGESGEDAIIFFGRSKIIEAKE